MDRKLEAALKKAPRAHTPTLTLPYVTLPYLAIPYPHPTLPDLTLPYLTLPYPTLPYLTRPFPTLPYLTLPYTTVPYPALPYPTLPRPARTHARAHLADSGRGGTEAKRASASVSDLAFDAALCSDSCTALPDPTHGHIFSPLENPVKGEIGHVTLKPKL